MTQNQTVGQIAAKEMENDIHLHIYPENNILFPKAIALEEQLLG